MSDKLNSTRIKVGLSNIEKASIKKRRNGPINYIDQNISFALGTQDTTPPDNDETYHEWHVIGNVYHVAFKCFVKAS